RARAAASAAPGSIARRTRSSVFRRSDDPGRLAAAPAPRRELVRVRRQSAAARPASRKLPAMAGSRSVRMRKWLWFGAVALLLGGFVQLTEALLDGDGALEAFDRRVGAAMAALRHPALTSAARDVTALGSTAVVTIVS